MEPLSTEPYKGVRDFYPDEYAKRATMFARIRETLLHWGYEEYDASPLERAELYEAKTSEEIVNEQTYTFTDRGNRRVTLRPEMTPTLARMVAAKRRELAFPLRWFSIPNLFRYERPQRGRLREHYQLNVDLLGLSAGEADTEIVSVASNILKAFGASENTFTIRINSRTLLTAACDAAGLNNDTSRAYIRLLDKKNKIPTDEFATKLAEITQKDPLAIIADESDERVADEKHTLFEAIEALKSRAVGNAIFDPTITRGFDYYTGIVFEVFDTDTENPRSIFGGGRYDKLVSLFGGDPIPAVGFGMGDVTLTDFLETHHLSLNASDRTPHIYIGTPSPSDIPAAQALATTLRVNGARVLVNLSGKPLSDQIKNAVKRGIPLFAAYGRDEVTNGVIRLKTLSSGKEVRLSAFELAKRLTS